MNFKINATKYVSSLTISFIGSESFKFASSIYIYRITGDIWLVSLLYLLIQLPSMFVYFVSPWLVKKFKNDRLALFLRDMTSLVSLVLPIVLFFTVDKYSFSMSLIGISTFLGLVHSFRFIYLKNIIFFISKNNEEMKKYNTFSSLATSLGVTISLFFSYFLYNKLEFFWLIVFNMLTYIISGFLYFSLKTSKESAIFHKSEFNKKTNLKKHKILSWIYILAGSAIIGFFTFPKTQGLTQIFDFMKNDYNVETWGFYISLIFSVFGILGTIITLMLLKTKRLKTKKTLVEYSLCAIILLSLILVIVFFANSKNEVMFFTFVSIVSLHQLLFSIFLSYFYSNSYEMFDQKSFHKQNGYSIVFRVVLSSILFVLFTLSSKQLDYRYTFVFYAALLLLFTSLIIISTFLRRRYKKVETEQKKEII